MGSKGRRFISIVITMSQEVTPVTTPVTTPVAAATQPFSFSQGIPQLHRSGDPKISYRISDTLRFHYGKLQNFVNGEWKTRGNDTYNDTPNYQKTKLNFSNAVKLSGGQTRRRSKRGRRRSYKRRKNLC